MSDGADQELARLRQEKDAMARELADERRFRRAFEAGLAGQLISSFEVGRYVEVNQAFADQLGYTREEILAADPYQFWVSTTHRDDLELERPLFQRVVAGEISSYRLEKRCVRKDGAFRWVSLGVEAVRDERGTIRYNVITSVDIHALKTAEEARSELEAKLRQVQKLETVGRLVGGVAHDFNNRLLVIMGYGHMLKEGVADDPTLSSQADVVVSSAQRAAELTRQLLAYSRRQVLRPRASDLNHVVDGTRRMLERLIGEQVELVTALGARNLMLADPGQVEQVLMNLVLNARDAMPSGGRITLETKDVTVSEAAPFDQLPVGGYVAFSVTDTGTGIPKELRATIFEPFFTTKGPGRGTGLGLAMVEGIVRQSGGAIALESEVGRGSSFTVYLPRARDGAVEAATKKSESLSESSASGLAGGLSGRETVLVVDDEDDVRTLLAEVLRMGPFQVLEARDGQQALQIAQSHPHTISVLVTDIVMPGITGTELADLLRQRAPELKVLFMSGYTERERVRQLYDSEQFIPKPFLPVELFHRVDALLRASDLETQKTA